MPRRALPASPGAQRGAIGLLAMGVLGLVILCLVLALDVGRLYYEKAKLQKQADTAAMEAAAQGPMCSGGEKDDFEKDDPNTTFGSMVWNESGEEWKFDDHPGNGLRDAAEVVLEKDVPTSLVVNIKRALDIDEDKTTLTARAVARRLPVAGLGVGNSLLSLDSANSPLLGPLVSSLVGYDAAVSVLDASQVASITLGDLFNTSSASELGDLQEDSYSSSALIQMIGEAAGVSGIASGSASQGKLINVLDILDLSALQGGRESLLDLSIPLEPLLNAVVTAANVDAPLMQENVDSGAVELNLESKLMPDAIDLGLMIQSPAKIAFGPPGKDLGTEKYRTKVTSAQVKVWLNSRLDVSPLASFDLGVVAEIGKAEAWLGSIECQGANQYAVEVVSRPSVLELQLGSIKDPNGGSSEVEPISVDLLNSVASVVIKTARSSSKGENIEVMSSLFQGSYPESYNVAPGLKILQRDIDRLLEGVSIKVNFLGADLGLNYILDLVREVVDPVVNGLLVGTLDPLLKTLGVSVNQYQVSVYSPQAKVELVK
ncbi:Uncharacterized membrane protein [Chromohalobacter canadensis]|uniref:Uncharacterized membrane protein n=1 Tax=Chromohalobacter canadensis TaxID=141389 RepID=A0A285VQ91_9GAMM|nr:pilus assembly protein TadG-related protein [Chromohalobacter canadensis]SOC56230.1 Uncharacterized membrane protein [Chromohalobacter canadensis]